VVLVAQANDTVPLGSTVVDVVEFGGTLVVGTVGGTVEVAD